MATLTIHEKHQTIVLKLIREKGDWLMDILPKLKVSPNPSWTLEDIRKNYTASGLHDFDRFWEGKSMSKLRGGGLLCL